MSRRRIASNGVRGPTSALTEFLRSQNITPTTVARRVALNEDNANEGGATDPAQEQVEEPAGEEEEEAGPSSSRRRTRQRDAGYNSDELDEPPAPAKKQKVTKATTAKAKAAAKKKKEAEEAEDKNDPYNALSRSAFSNAGASSSKPPVGSFDTCAKCGKQFTVTKYTMAADPGPGYLCHPCAKSSGADPFKKPAAPRKRKPAAAERRTVQHFQESMFPSLASICIQVISRHLEDIDAFGDIGALNKESISKAIARNRSLSGENAHLFYDVTNSRLRFHDATKLNPDALITLGYLNPNLTTLHLDFCGLMSDEVITSWAKSLPCLTSLTLFGPFLVRSPAWIEFFKNHAPLECFDITQSPRFNLFCLNALIKSSGQTLRTLGLKEIGQLNDDFLDSICRLSNTLTSLDISDAGESCSDEAIIEMLSVVGPSLTHFGMANHYSVTDDVLSKGLQPYVKNLTSLNIEGLIELTDEGVARFFNEWENRPFVSFNGSRIPSMGNNAFEALLKHSGADLVRLNINGWKDVTDKALGGLVKGAPQLQTVDLGFCRGVDDFMIKTLIEKNNGTLKEVKVWGCNRVEGKWEVFGAGKRHPNLRIHGLESYSVI